MITRKLTKPIVCLKRCNSIASSFLSLNLMRMFSNNNDLTNVENRQELLSSVLTEVNMKKSASIMLEDTEEIQRRKAKQLTKQEKLKLGLYVPKMALNPRMNINSQLEYRSQICQNLYQQQKAHLQTNVRILQKMTQSEKFTIDSYINAVYKDIYARYLVNKEIGIEWNGKYSAYGVMNSKETLASPQNLVSSFLKANLQKIEKIQSVAPYSYLTQSFVPPDFIEVQNIRKIGYFFRLPLIEFGKHEKNFEKLKQKGNKVQLLVFCQFLQKMVNPQCLCIAPGKKMIILKRQFIERKSPSISEKSSKQAESESELKFEYLITFLQVFNKHKQYFTSKSYEKHLVFESDHLVGMRAEYGSNISVVEDESQGQKLQVMSQIEGYERDENVYIVNGATSIPDYERVQEFVGNGGEVDKLRNVLDAKGGLALNNMLFKSGNNGTPLENKGQKQDKLSIIDIEFQDKILEALKNKFHFQELYDVFEDQVYSNKHTNELLRFRLFNKLQISISQQSYTTLDEHFSSNNTSMTIHESKVKLPENKRFNKPRQRRQFRKQVKESLKQRTEYMTLSESIRSISSIPISSSIEGDIKIWVQNDQEGNIVGVFQSRDQVQKRQNTNTTIEELTVSTDLISALTYMFNTKHSGDINSVIIEPQTITEEILPLCLHLALIRHKPEPVKRGRRNAKQQNSEIKRLLQSFKMVYLHPTITPSQRQLQVDSFIQGSMKISNKHDYGYGFEAIRLWVCRHSEYLGDREVKQRDVNQQLKQSSFIRKLYAQLIPLAPRSQFADEIAQIEQEKMNFLDRFMMEQINAYVLNMQHFYSKLMLKQAYQYTVDFFRNVVDEIFLSTVRHHAITYPNEEQNLYHGVTVRRLLELLSVISPLLPFTTYHISKQQILRWPQVDNRSTFYKNLLQYNALIKIRTELKNKLILNQFLHCEVVFPISDQLLYNQNDLKKFFGVDKISFVNPEVKEKSFGFKLRFNQTLGGKSKIQIYESKDHCIRCDPHSNQKDHLCLACTSYLETNIGKQIEFYDKRNNSLLIQSKQEQRKEIRTENQAIK